MNKIDEICKRRHISYSELGRQAKISSMYVGLLAKGKRNNPSLEVMQNISNALGEKVERVFKVNESINQKEVSWLEDVVYTVVELTKILKINKNAVYSLLNKGLIKYLILGGKKVRKITLDEFLEKYDGKDLSDLDNIKDL